MSTTRIIRRAQLKDVNHLVFIALRLAKETMPEMRPDKEKIHKLMIECISGAANFAEVVEEDGVIRACLLAMVGDNLVYERKMANVMLWWSDIVGYGARLLKRFRTWVEGRRIIRIAGLNPDFDWGDRTSKLVATLGFEKHGGTFAFYN